MKRWNGIATAGVAERMLQDVGGDVRKRASLIATMEWADADIAWRALASQGPAVPAGRHGEPAALRHEVLAPIARCRYHRGAYRLRNDHQFGIAHRGRR